MSDTIDVVINIEDISSQLNSARSQLVSFKKELSDMPDMSETFTEGLDRTISAIELLQKKATEYDSSSSSPRRQTLASD